MEEIFNHKKQNQFCVLYSVFHKKGFVLISSVIIMSLLLLLAIYVINFTTIELKISNSQLTATKTYYIAESGIAEAIWLIKNDANWKDEFETNSSCELVKERPNFPDINSNYGYTIIVNCTDKAKGTITATSHINTDSGKIAQRIVKTTIYKATGGSILGENGEVADGNINLNGTLLNIYNGSMMSNGNILVSFWSTINADSAIKATGNINTNWTSTINASSLEASNYPPAPDPQAMPSISFDDAGDPDSLKNRADAIYAENEFKNLMWNNQNLTLNGITYVEGDIEIKGAQNLTINGVLVADGDIEVGKNTWFCCWGWSRCGSSNVTINQIPDTPSGLLSKRKIDFELCLNNFNANGLIYGGDQIHVLSMPGSFNINGAMVSRKLTLTSIWQGMNITFNANTTNDALGEATFSPIITVEHWEEEY